MKFLLSSYKFEKEEGREGLEEEEGEAAPPAVIPDSATAYRNSEIQDAGGWRNADRRKAKVLRHGGRCTPYKLRTKRTPY